MLLKSSLFTSKTFISLICLLLIQQVIIGSSSIWITQLIANLSNNQYALYLFAIYIFSLLLPYVPGAYIIIQLTKLKVETSIKFMQKFMELYPNQILHWTNSDEQNKKIAIVSGEASNIITDYIDYLYQVISASLNVIISLAMVAIIIDYTIVFFYFLGMFLSLFILILQKKNKTFLSIAAQESRIKWNSLLLKFWDNVLLNNIYSLSKLKDNFSHKSIDFTKNSVKLEKFNQIISISMAFLLMSPTFIYLIFLAYQKVNDSAWLAMTIVLLPRLFQTLSYSYELLFLFSNLPMQNVNITTVLSLINKSSLLKEEEEISLLEKRVNLEKITLSFNKEKINPEIIEKLPTSGRITLQGDNGSGKTSLLLLIKKKYNESAFYLPSKHDLLFMINSHKFSTGEKAKKILHEIKESLEVPIILLDEWDANLDINAKREISSVIDELSKKYCVVESRHNFIEGK
ncbi:FeS assembly ATPase SufC [Candidatus Rubidus massiliensis]|nr:FeS assembly ATPase SufC [Candidatus Rubidus massiliensis]